MHVVLILAHMFWLKKVNHTHTPILLEGLAAQYTMIWARALGSISILHANILVLLMSVASS